MEQQSFWQRLKTRRRVAIVDDQSLNELWSFRLSALGLTIVLVVLFLITVTLLSLAIVFTPMKSILPGYNQNIREQLMSESVRVDSLSTIVDLQHQYLDVIRNITAGEVSTDSVPASSDSLQLIFREELLQAKNEATEEFLTQYEQKEKDNMLLFDAPNVQPTVTVFCPLRGIVVEHFAPQNGCYGVTIAAAAKENVSAVLAGCVVMIEPETDGTVTVVMQHANYLSVYRHLGHLIRQRGDVLRAGETIGWVNDNVPVQLELWKDGAVVNPEEVIAF
ncbi:MAG: M23 family metallopeptidase [Paludibacteraceae bacterium]|nr:M23 family metallopeptidase [Paludibacteraceae bacterium]